MKAMRIFLIALFAGFVALVSGCGSRQDSGNGRPIVTVSVPAQQFLLEQIVGDAYDVRSLMRAETDVESFEPSISDMASAADGKAYITVGTLPFEKIIAGRMAQGGTNVPVFDSMKGIEPLTGTHGDDEIDPHVWVSLRNAIIMAANMRDAMSKIDPANSRTFAEGYERLATMLDSLDEAASRRLDATKGKAFIVWHPSMGYLARDYGLRQIAVGGHEHKELSIPELRKRLEAAKAGDAVVMFTEPGANPRRAQMVKEVTGVNIVEIAPADYGWFDKFDRFVSGMCDGN